MWLPSALLLLACVLGCSSQEPVVKPVEVAKPVAQAQVEQKAPSAPARPRRDDGRSLWASPTAGKAIDLSLVPDGSEVVLHLRPAALLASEEGRRAWQALGPSGEAARDAIESGAGAPLESIDRFVLGLAPGKSYGEYETSISIDSEPSDELPLLRREIEQLLDSSDEARHLTLLFTPSFVLGDGGSLLKGAWEPVREELLATTRDEWRAYSLSLHVGEQFYWELRVVGDASMPQTKSAQTMQALSKVWPVSLQATIEAGAWSDYSRAILVRYGQMFELLSNYTRRGVEGRQAILNGYLPQRAGHNLLLGAELLIAESQGFTDQTVALKTTETPKTLAEMLEAEVTLVFARESLETAVGLLADAMGASITIEGRDLQLEGITRNQMLKLDVKQRPAAEVLVEVLRRANPDTEATGPTDLRQKLVYVVQPNEQPERIVITTRAAAERRGEPLPEVFTP